MKKVNWIVTTDGRGLWSRHCANVRVIGFDVGSLFKSDYNDTTNPAEASWGELRIYFDRRTWNVTKLGLIYTDPFWMKEFRRQLQQEFGFSDEAAKDVDYSEQGMQGDNYVSCDVGKKFLKEYATNSHVKTQIKSTN